MQSIYSEEGHGSNGHRKLQILVEIVPEVDLKDELISRAARKAAQEINDAITTVQMQNDLTVKIEVAADRQEIIALFRSAIFVEEVPNEYGSGPYYKFHPWYVITTGVGRFKIGWRKRVLQLSWDQTTCNKLAQDLFPNEDVTKFDKTIHAWSYEDAKRYIDVIITNAT